MDKIVLNGMSFYAYHGVSDDERRLGQRFVVDAEIYFDLSQAGAEDDIERSVDYAGVYKQIEEMVTGQSFHLLEALAEKLAAKILSNQRVEKVVLRVKKAQPPIAGNIESVWVEVCRKR